MPALQNLTQSVHIMTVPAALGEGPRPFPAQLLQPHVSSRDISPRTQRLLLLEPCTINIVFRVVQLPLATSVHNNVKPEILGGLTISLSLSCFFPTFCLGESSGELPASESQTTWRQSPKSTSLGGLPLRNRGFWRIVKKETTRP